MKRDQKSAVEKAYESLRKNPEKFKEQFSHLSSKSHEELVERYRKDNKTSVVGAGGNW